MMSAEKPRPWTNGGRRAPDPLVARGRRFDDGLRHALGLQLMADSRGAILAREQARPHLGVTVVGKLFSCLELLEQRFEDLDRFGVRRELARQLLAGMLA